MTAVIAILAAIYALLTGLIWRAILQNTRATRQILEATNRLSAGMKIHHETVDSAALVMAR